MAKRRIGWGAGALLVVAALCLGLAGTARAAGEWEWTAGQGWVMGAGVSRPTPKEQLAYAYELEQKGEFMDSARQYFLLVQNFPNSQEAGIGLQRLARCLFEMENYYTSYKAIEQVITTYPNTGRMTDLLAIELSIAKKMMVSQTPDILATNERDARAANVRRALEIVSSVIDHDPYGPSAAEAYLVKGEGNLFIGEVNTARASFEKVRDEFPRSDFVERARLGILRCDQQMGEARPQEVAEQAEVVRQEEARRRRGGQADEFDDVDNAMRHMDEVEANKMMGQADMYRRMGTPKSVRSSQFLYKEIARRFPGTPQAEEAMAKSGDLRIPPEQGRIAKSIKSINLNPFTWNKDPEPPWIVPQLAPEDMVMIDSGFGPIVGVPESGLPQTAAAAGVRPAGLQAAPSVDLAAAPAAGFSPASAAPGRAPAFIDGTAGSGAGVGGTQYLSSAPSGPMPPPAAYVPGSQPMGMGSQPMAMGSPNPLPGISDGDLVAVGDSYGAYRGSQYGAGGPPPAQPVRNGYGTGYIPPASAPVANPAPLPDLGPSYSAPSAPPVLGAIDYNTPMSDLVGPARGLGQAPLPEYVTSGYVQTAPTPAPAPQGGAYYYDPATAYPAPQPYQAPAYPAAGQPAQNGGWTLGSDFR